jgi:hypothetical protein
LLFCLAEDRPKEEVALRLLLLSLAEHCPGIPIRLTFPPASDDFREWVSRLQDVELRTTPLRGAHGWNVKPHALMDALDAGATSVVWVDSDIIVTHPFAHLFRDLADDVIAVCEETYWGQHQGGTHRTESWGLRAGRALPVTCNTGVIRVTPRHRAFLETWEGMLDDPHYRDVQTRPSLQRPIHMLSDQEVFTALIGAEAFASFPLRFIRRGREIIQNFGPSGYTPGDRARHLVTGLPPLVHAMGVRPWHFEASPPFADRRRWYEALYAEVSPYAHVASRYRDDISDRAWLDRRTLPGRILRVVGLGHPALKSAPLALLDAAVRSGRRLLGIDRYEIAPPPPSRDDTAPGRGASA